MLQSLPNLIGYSVPTILVIAGLVLFFLSFFRDMQPTQVTSARIYGFIIGMTGIVLALTIKPPEPKQQPGAVVWILPTPASVSSSGVTLATTTPDSPSSTNTPIAQATATDATVTQVPIATEILSSPTVPVPATAPILPPATDTPEPVTSVIPVWAIDENGVRVNISTSGVYKVAYLGDAYSPWPNEQYEGYRGWSNIVRIYVNRSVEWGQTDYSLVGPTNQDDFLGPGGYYLDKKQAIASATGDSRTFRLNAGDYLILVPLDEKGRYNDNQGKVDIGITYLGQ